MKTAAMLFRNLCYERRDEASAGIICAGWDEREGGQVRILNFVSSVKFEKSFFVITVPSAEVTNKFH